MHRQTIDQWIDRLDSISREVLRNTPLLSVSTDPLLVEHWIGGFKDELGHCRKLDRAVLARLTGTDPGPMPEPPTPDVVHWWSSPAALTSGRAIEPIVPQDPNQGIELWTEIELASLHAVWNRVIDHADPAWGMCARNAVEWHLNELQPDNATSHSFAIHGFIIYAHERVDANAWLHAEMMLHSALLGRGAPDRFSACLMLDASRGLARYRKRELHQT